MKNQPKAKVRRIPALAGAGGEGSACVEDQGGGPVIKMSFHKKSR